MSVLELEREGRPLRTWLHLPDDAPPWPLVVFVHGWLGHPRKFRRLFRALTGAGYAVAAAAFPFTNDEAERTDFDDVARQPEDVSFLLDRLLEDRRFDPARVAVAGFSLGAFTTMAVVCGDEPRIRAAVAIAGGLPRFGPRLPRALPLLVVHGRHDEVVPYAQGVEAYRAAPGPKALVTVEHPGHHEFVEDEPRTAADDVVPAATTAFLRGEALPKLSYATIEEAR